MSRDYGQFCGLARALELVGGRWALLVVRDLLGGPKRFTDLQEGLPGIPSNVLTARLRELEEAGIVHRRLLARPSTGVVYELTEYGRELDEAVIRLGLWGARALGPPKEDDFISVNALALGLRGAFRPENAKGVAREYELRIDGQQLRISIRDGRVSFPSEQTPSPHLVVEVGADAMYELLTGLVGVDEASASGRVRIRGSRADARRFFKMFPMAPPVDAAVHEHVSSRGATGAVASNEKPLRKTPTRR